MGLFEKKYCCICGEKAGLLSKTKLKDKKYLCSDCTDRCSSDWIDNEDMEKVDEKTVREHMDYMEKNNQLYHDVFEASEVIEDDRVMSDEIFSYDVEKGWWTHNDDTMLYRFCDVKHYSYHLETSEKEDDDDDNDDRDGGILGGLLEIAADVATNLSNSNNYGRDDIQTCGINEKIDTMYIDVVVKNPWARRVRIVIIDSETENASAMQQGYRNSAKIMNLLDKYMDSECKEINCGA